ncbi:MAG: hypothetical protein IKX97_08280 [Erysipelotrichaceae bacterium]|nr:hypothetical protein [Erysipelotrichaceae bacterium]
MAKINGNIRHVFFDVDGVLSAPCYFDDANGEFTIGFTDEGWRNYLNNEGVYAYKYCSPVKQISDFITQLNSLGVNAYVLSVVENDVEARSKDLFIDEKYPGMFKDRFYVEHEDDKARFMVEFAVSRGIDAGSCMLVDDTYSILTQCRAHGLCACHLSNILADNITK